MVLQIVHLLFEHHEAQSKSCKQKAEEICNKMEACATNIPNLTEQQTLTSFAITAAKEVQDQARKLATDLKAKREKRKRDWEGKTLNEPVPPKPKSRRS